MQYRGRTIFIFFIRLLQYLKKDNADIFFSFPANIRRYHFFPFIPILCVTKRSKIKSANNIGHFIYELSQTETISICLKVYRTVFFFWLKMYLFTCSWNTFFLKEKVNICKIHKIVRMKKNWNNLTSIGVNTMISATVISTILWAITKTCIIACWSHCWEFYCISTVTIETPFN